MSLAVLDWRRRVSEIYREVRDAPSPAAGHARWRAGREQLLNSHAASPVPPGERATRLPGRYGLYDPALRFTAELDGEVEPVRWAAETGTDGTVVFERIGRVHLGAQGSLDVWWLTGYGGGVFVPLRDPNPLTYGGGRYVIDTAKGADLGGEVDPDTGRGTLVVDLNFAYNPSCAYDPAWACPLAPEGNHLSVALGGGELHPATH